MDTFLLYCTYYRDNEIVGITEGSGGPTPEGGARSRSEGEGIHQFQWPRVANGVPLEKLPATAIAYIIKAASFRGEFPTRFPTSIPSSPAHSLQWVPALLQRLRLWPMVIFSTPTGSGPTTKGICQSPLLITQADKSGKAYCP